MENKHEISIANGKICYIELPAIDLIISSNFYKAVFKWEINYRENGDITFHDGVEVSGRWVMDRKPASEIRMLVHIMVDDIDATIQLIIENDGKIVSPKSMHGSSFSALFNDPAGNILGVYQQ